MSSGSPGPTPTPISRAGGAHNPRLASALTAAAAMALPPMRPRTIEEGHADGSPSRAPPWIPPRRRSRRECRGSPPVAARRRRAFRASGTTPSARCRWRPRPAEPSPHSSSAAAERVVASCVGQRGHAGIAQQVQTTSLCAGSRARVMPCATISASHRIGAPWPARVARRSDQTVTEDNVRGRLDQTAGVDHAHRDFGFVGGEAREIGLGADDGERALVDGGAVAQIGGSSAMDGLADLQKRVRPRPRGRRARRGSPASPARCRLE